MRVQWCSWPILLGLLLELTAASRLPLIVFQHHHNLYHRLEDMFDDWALQTTVSPEYHAYKTDDTEFRPLRILYQVGVSSCDIPTINYLLYCYLLFISRKPSCLKYIKLNFT